MSGTWLGCFHSGKVCGWTGWTGKDRAARDRKNILPHETPRERFQQGEDKERAESMTNRNIREVPQPLAHSHHLDRINQQGRVFWTAEILHSLLDPLGKTPPNLSSLPLWEEEPRLFGFFPRASWNSEHLSHLSSVPNFSRPNLCCSSSAVPPKYRAERFWWQFSTGCLFASISLSTQTCLGVCDVFISRKRKGFLFETLC